MQHLHLVQQQIANVREDMSKLWSLERKGSSGIKIKKSPTQN